MAVPFFKLVHYKENSTFGKDLTTCVDLRQSRGLEAKANTLNFQLKNTFGDFNNFFSPMDTIKLWIDYAPLTDEVILNQTPVIIGLVQEFTHTVDDNGRNISVKCMDRTLHFLNKLWADYKENTAPNIIVDVINSTTDTGNETYTVDARTRTNGGRVVDTRTGTWKGVSVKDSAFDTIQYGATFKTVYEWITDLSQPEYTHDDKPYIFYVDEHNSFHWFYPSGDNPDILTDITTDVVIYDVSFEKSVFDIVNCVIFSAGTDLEGHGITGLYVSPTATAQTLVMKYYEWPGDIAEKVKADELQAMAKNAITYDAKGYPDNYTLYNNAHCNTWNDDTITDDTTYNDRFRLRCRYGYPDKSVDGLGRAAAANLTDQTSDLRWRGKIEVKGTKSFLTGDLMQVTYPAIGMTTQKLRLKDVTHHLSSAGWFTELEFEEDQKAITS